MRDILSPRKCLQIYDFFCKAECSSAYKVKINLCVWILLANFACIFVGELYPLQKHKYRQHKI